MARKRLRDEWGSIAEVDRNRRYRIRYWGKDENGVYRRMTCTVRGTRRDAERKRAELMLEHSEEAQCVDVDYVWEHWYMPMLKRRCDEGELSEKTASQYKSRYKSTIAERWGSVPCDGIRPLDVQQWVDTLSYNKANQSLNMLRPMLDFAVRYGEILNNPFRERYVMPSKSTITHKDDGVWTLSQLTTVWDKARGEWFEGAFICAAFGGCRVGESIGVQVNDIERIDFDGLTVAVVRIRRQVKNAGGVTDRLKNPQSRRSIVIVGKPAERLCEIAETAPIWVTGNGFGEPTKQLTLGNSWKRLKGSLPDGMWHPFRNLRNSYQTFMRWEVGLAPHYIEELLGHKGTTVTDLYYDRPDESAIVSVTVDAWRSYLGLGT